MTPAVKLVRISLTLGLLLLVLIYAVNLTLTWVQQRERPL